MPITIVPNHFEGIGIIRPLEANDEIAVTERLPAPYSGSRRGLAQRLPQPPDVDSLTRRRDDGEFRLAPDCARRRRCDGKAGGETRGESGKDGNKGWVGVRASG